MEAKKAFATKTTPSSILAKGLGAAALLSALTLASTSVSAKEYFTIVDGALERNRRVP
ncbi:hypothetical protein [Enterovibrio norvegicus]|uniref:hypothetical protein n=1 Tax=Enterovibrio norvegicus TaxID=188144 RepID=UPI0024B1E6DD|nr:hypothetical protein [Enterovibrio norvegicus]